MGARSGEDGAGEKPASKEADAQLLADIKAFAAELGLGGGGGAAAASDAAFDDFAPARAAKKIAPKQPRKRQHEEADEEPHEEPRRPPKQQAAANGKPVAAARPAPAAPKADVLAPLPPVSGWARAKSILQREEAGLWWEAPGAVPRPAPAAPPAAPLAAQLRERGEQLLANEAAAFEAASSRGGAGGSSDLRWLQQAQRGGTTSDKVAAMAVLVQEAPAANLRSLDALIAMAGKRGGARAVVGSALDALRELWLEILLPPDRKLRFLDAQPLGSLAGGGAGSQRDADRQLLYWALEDALKARYAAFVQALDALSRDNLDFVKDRAIKTSYDLLAGRPEQEVALLTLLVNKLGDPGRKLASKVGYLLMRLLSEHPGMRAVLVREVERFVFRPGLADRARYYAVVYLNQIGLTHRDAAPGAPGPGGAGAGGASLARRLVDLYFTLFKLVLEGKVGTAAALAGAARDKAAREAAARAARRGRKKAPAPAPPPEEGAAGAGPAQGQHSGEMDARMLSALITGVRRAFPYVSAEEVEPLIEAHADALFRLIHTGSFGVATQALLLLLQLMTSRNSLSDRFYRALYAVLASPELPRSTKAPMFLSLLFKALKADASPKRAAAFAKRVLQVALGAPPNFACGCLMLVSELLRERPGLWSAVLQPEDKEDDGVERFVDAPDPDAPPPAAVAALAPPGKGGRKKGAAAAVAKIDLGGNEADGSEREEEDGSEEEEEEEVGLSDSSDEDGGESSDEEEEEEEAAAPAPARAPARAPTAAAAPPAAEGWPAGKEGYDMRKRDPQFAHAERSCLWELLPLASHAHPSVAAQARALLAGANVSYAGDPLRDLTLAAFLDKFVAKKPKAATKGDSRMQPLRSAGGGGVGAGGAVGAAFASLAEKDVAPDDAFFHKYYSLQAVQSAAARAADRRRKKVAARAGDDEEALVSDAEDDGSDSDGLDDFLAGEEDGGDEGIGADPDRATGFDYSGLAAAMDDSSSDDDDDGSASESAGSEGAGGSEEGGSDDAEEAEEEDSKEEGISGGSEEGLELEGAQFSDMSGDEGGADASPRGSLSGSDLEAGAGAGSELDLEGELDSEDAGSLDNLSDLDDDGDGGGGGGGSSSEDDAAADAEVAELLARHAKALNKRPVAAAAAPAGRHTRGAAPAADVAGAEDEDEEMEALNPFELAEATDSEDGGSGSEDGSGSDSGSDEDGSALDDGFVESDDGSGGSDGGGGGGGKGGGALSVFASADDYATMIDRDFEAEGQEGEAEEEEAPRGAGRAARGGGRGRGRGGAARGRRRG